MRSVRPSLRLQGLQPALRRFGGALASLALLGGCQSHDPSRSVRDCLALERQAAQVGSFEGYVDSQLTPDGHLGVGTKAGCSDERGAAAFTAALSAWTALPESGRPSLLRVAVVTPSTPLRGLEFDADSGAILSPRDEVLPRVAWFHELGHALSRGARPGSLVRRRLHTAFSEAVADYFAAVHNGSPDLAPSGRHLERPPKLGASDWARLAVPAAPFDAHRFGALLAAAMWREAPSDGPLLKGAVSCLREFAAESLDSTSPQFDTPRRFVNAVLHGCDDAVRPKMKRLLRGWIPASLLG